MATNEFGRTSLARIAIGGCLTFAQLSWPELAKAEEEKYPQIEELFLKNDDIFYQLAMRLAPDLDTGPNDESVWSAQIINDRKNLLKSYKHDFQYYHIPPPLPERIQQWIKDKNMQEWYSIANITLLRTLIQTPEVHRVAIVQQNEKESYLGVLLRRTDFPGQERGQKLQTNMKLIIPKVREMPVIVIDPSKSIRNVPFPA